MIGPSECGFRMLSDDSEQWLQIPSFPAYEASTLGRFRRVRSGKILKGTVAHNGYIHIGLLLNGRQVWKLAHRLIAETFLTPASPAHCVVNHSDKVRSNNAVTNLEWATRSWNSRHAKIDKRQDGIFFSGEDRRLLTGPLEHAILEQQTTSGENHLPSRPSFPQQVML